MASANEKYLCSADEQHCVETRVSRVSTQYRMEALAYALSARRGQAQGKQGSRWRITSTRKKQEDDMGWYNPTVRHQPPYLDEPWERSSG